MKTTMRKALTLAAAIVLTFVSTVPAFAVVKAEDAAAGLVNGKIYRGDENGDLNLDKGLTRAELAVILMRIDFTPGATMDERMNKWFADKLSQGSKYSKFTDVPSWAAPHVEYCYNAGYMNGISETRFDPSGQVNPKMVCTVVMRQFKIAEGDWDYDTSLTKAQAIGLTEDANVSGATITRGDTAIILHRAIGGHYNKETPTPGTAVPLPTTPTAGTDINPLPATPEPEKDAEQYAAGFEEMKAEVVRLVNEERVKAGLSALEVLPELMDCAQRKAQDMIDNNYFGHDSPEYGSVYEMVTSFVPNSDGARENIAKTTTVQNTVHANVVVNGWTASKEHYKNMTDSKMTHVGVGIVNIEGNTHIWVLQLVAK